MAPLGLLPSSVKEERGPVHLKFKLHQQQLIQNQDPWDKPNRPHQVYTTTFLSFFGKGNSNPLQYSGLENSMDRRAWPATGHVVTKSQKQMRNFHLLIRQVAKKELRVGRISESQGPPGPSQELL